jgi:hypothetical protein
MLSLEEISIHQPVNSPDEWLALCRRYRGDAQTLRDTLRPDGAWMNAGFAIECCLKAAIMKKENVFRVAERAWIFDRESAAKAGGRYLRSGV